MSDDKLYSRMWDIFSNINEQLRFAEAKNGALLTIDLGILFGIGSTLASEVSFVDTHYRVIYLSAGLLTLASIIALLSFLPFLGARHRDADRDGHRGNTIYFMSIARMGEAVFLRELSSLLGVSQHTEFDLQLANQIATNSRIAARKFQYFRIGGWITLSAIAVPFLAFIWFFATEGWR